MASSGTPGGSLTITHSQGQMRNGPPLSSGTTPSGLGPLPRAPRRRRLVLTASQKGALQAFFQENPYPGITAREHLARELAISESRIQLERKPSLRTGPLVRRMTPVSSVFLVKVSSAPYRGLQQELHPLPMRMTKEEMTLVPMPSVVGFPTVPVPQVWVQNQRTRQLRQSRRLDSRIPQGEGPPNGKGQPPGRVPKEGRRKRTSISASQTSILLQAFEEERFPGIGMRESLARKTGIPEARIQSRTEGRADANVAVLDVEDWLPTPFARPITDVPAVRPRSHESKALRQRIWFSTRSHPRVDGGRGVEGSREQTSGRGLSWGRERRAAEALARQSDTGPVCSRLGSQGCPGHAHGFRRPMERVWFQNRRARHPGQSPSGPKNALAANHKPSPRGTVPLDQSHLWRVPRSSPNLAPFDPLASMQTQAAGTPPVSSVDVVPPVSCGGFGRLIPGASLVPPTLGGQGGNAAAPRDLGSRSCPGLTRGGGLSPGHADLGLPSPGRCQQPKEHPSKAPLLLQVGPRPPPADPPQHWGHAGPSGTDQAMPRRGQSSQAVMGTAGSQDGTGQQPAPGESPAWWQQPPPPAGPCVPLPPQHQLCTDTSSFLQELLSADEMEEDVHPLWVGPLREEEPPGPLEAPLSEDDYHALLEMLQDSLWPQA
ncbi:Double homeobox protein 4C [Vulpes lagopus]